MQYPKNSESFSISPLILSEDGWKDAKNIQKGENVFYITGLSES
jgi:hypothetical protein